MSGLFGWNLLYSSVASDIKNNEDILLCLTHLVLISEGFQCIGLGDSKNVDGTEEKSETLPKGWNTANALRYLHSGRLYNLQATRLDDGIMLNLTRVDERNVAMIQLNTRMVLRRSGTLDEMIPNNKDIVKTVKQQLIEQVLTSTKTKNNSSQTVPHRNDISSSTSAPDLPPMPGGMYMPPEVGGAVGIGRNDLDPLANIGGPLLGGYPQGGIGPILPGGGGMLFQPPGRFDRDRTGLPPGAIPPGARFDPFRPPMADRFYPPRRPNPDNDDLPPPGFNDDMYM